MRAYGNFKREGVACFELDQAELQQQKRTALEAAGIGCGHVNFVSVDFGNESAFEKLIESGFDLNKKTLLLWEGVTLYLSEADVRKTIQDIRTRAAVGSVLLADIYADRMLARFKSGAGKKTMEYTNEGLDFSLNFTTNYEGVLEKFLTSESMAAGETFFMGRKHEKGPFVVIVEMKCD